MPTFRKLFLLFSVMLAVSSLFAQTKTDGSRLLDHTYRFIGKMRMYAFAASIIDTDKAGTYKHTIYAKVSRPDKLRIDTFGDLKNRSVYIDNGHFTVYDYDFKYYGQLDVPANIDKALDYLFDAYGIKAPIASLIYSDMYRRLRPKHVTYFGTRNIDGKTCDYIAFRWGSAIVHVWIQKSDTPLILAYTIIDKAEDGSVYRKDTAVRWNLRPHFDAKTFTFVPPKGAEKISVEPAQ